MRTSAPPNDGNLDRSYLQLNVRTLLSAILENSLVRMLRTAAGRVHHRWLAFCFARRFYGQACTADLAPRDSQLPATTPDLTECLYRQSLASRLHTLVQLRVASQIASIEETNLRARMCAEAGWSSEQIGAALLGNPYQGFSEAERLVLQYAEDMTRTPIDIDPQIVRQLRLHFSEAQLIELTAAIAHANFRTRFSDAKARLH